ncbi:MAG: hypothetical protein Q8P84_02255, partial [Deltaproteobacteria bacterium]|nr:hypothetical protein [Deltaproteobacteria bacterium]
HEVAVDRLSISDRIHQIIAIFETKETCRLTELLPEPLVRYDIVITFLALLEMTRLKMIRVHQEERFAALFITKAISELTLTENIQEA